jgi:hypothetical protein
MSLPSTESNPDIYPEDETARLLALYRERVESYPDAPVGYRERWSRLCRELLSHGGRLVVPPREPDPDLALLVSGGLVISEGPARRFIAGEPNGCHANASHLWVEKTAVAISTGYALSEDGLWRSHSWGVGADGELIETTEQRTAYAGVIRTGGDALFFVCNNNLEALEDVLARGGERAEELLHAMKDLLNDPALDRHAG